MQSPTSLDPELEAAQFKPARSAFAIAIAANFTAEPIRDTLEFWLHRLDASAEISFAPYNQVFQQLLDPTSLIRQNAQGANVILIRLEDWARSNAVIDLDAIEPQVADLIAALKTAREHSTTPYFVLLCPPSAGLAQHDALWSRMEALLAAEVATLPDVYLVLPAELQTCYAVEQPEDPVANELGHVPFTLEFFSALGTMVVRRLYALSGPKPKVLVLDCDETLWRGVCGEDGPDGIRLDESSLALQRFMREQRDQGLLLCIASKNNPEDVAEVFERNPGMPLKLEDFAATRINWTLKSRSMTEMAEELDLGPESFVLFDDNPRECAEVEMNCPGATAIAIPTDPLQCRRFLAHLWFLDRLKITAEDRVRARSYQQENERKRFATRSGSFSEFIGSLELQISIRPLVPEMAPRASQMTLRTNQFNCTTIRRTEGEIHQLSTEKECLVVDVRDRFGDYGLVGLLVLERGADRLVVETFLLSCRALGKGVEHQMLAHVGQLARARGLSQVEIPFIATAKNVPAREFLTQVRGPAPTHDHRSGPLVVSAEAAARTVFVPPNGAPRQINESRPELAGPSATSARLFTRSLRATHWCAITDELSEPKAVLRALQLQKQTTGAIARKVSTYVEPRTSLERKLAKIWCEALLQERVGVTDNFVELGGHSLLAVQLAVRVQLQLDVALPVQMVFEASTIEALARFIEHKGGSLSDSSSLPPLRVAPHERYDPFPLTDLQIAYLLGRSTGFELGNVPCYSYSEVEFEGLDLDRYQRAWQRLIQRHEMLRAVGLDNGQQRILEHVPAYQIATLDLRGKPSATVTAELATVREQMAEQLRPVTQWPLFEVRATRLDGNRTRIHAGFDLFIADAWSVDLLTRDLDRLYQDPEAALPELELSFRDYVLNESAFEQTEQYRRAEAYWRQRLETLPPAPELPLAKNPRELVKPRFVRRSGRLDSDRWRELKARGQQDGLTPSAILAAAFAEVLSLWSRTPRFSINLTLFNRLPLHPQVNDIAGEFTTPTLLEIDLAAAEPFCVRAKRLQQQLWNDLDHLYFNGVRVLRELTGTGDPTQAKMPVVLTSLLVQPGGASNDHGLWGLQGLRSEAIWGTTQTPQVLLDHIVREVNGDLCFNWDVVEELFPAGLMDEMFTAYCESITRLAIDDSAWREPRRRIVPDVALVPWQRSKGPDKPLPDRTLHELFAEQARRSGEQPAVFASGRTLTYRELFERSQQVARWLRDRGARPNTLVAVVMEKGWEQVVAVLGILASGAAYLPIDPSWPDERIQYLIEICDVRLALTQSSVEQRLSTAPEPQRLCVDRLLPSEAPFETLGGPGELAYVLFTSGSTGVPKGVMISHRSALNTVVDVNARFSVGASDRVLALSALSFDLSVYDLFGPLLAGGAVVIPDPTLERDSSHWRDLIERHRVTVWNSVPALMQVLVDDLETRSLPAPPSLRLAFLSGDWIPVNLPARLRACAPGVRLISLGGPTEASIWQVCYPVDEIQPTWVSVPYGRPLANQRVEVLDEALEPRPTWVPGELYIGGLGLARGYWKDELKTRERFIQHPLTGEQLYRSGDLGRYLPDGTIEFLGRTDFQVKVNGYRIELGEIEAALVQHPEVGEAAVTTVSERAGHPRLIAYVVKKATAVSPEAIDRLEFKTQQRGIRRDLPDTATMALARPPIDERFRAAYQMRRSHRQFLSGAVPIQRLERLLSCLSALEGDLLPKYRYPSAGGLYPVQVYLNVKERRVEGLPAGNYYYHPRDHRLICLSTVPLDRGVHVEINRPVFDEAAFSLFLVGELAAIAPLYGELARDFCLLEAGYVGQLLMTAAAEEQIGLCPIGSIQLESIRRCFKLSETQILLHSHVGGRGVDVRAGASESDGFGEQLRAFLQAKLPEYMVPETVVMLAALPLGPNGKIDRRALPRPAPGREVVVEIDIPEDRATSPFGAAAPERSPVDGFQTADATTRTALLERFLREEVGRVLQLDPSKISRDTPFRTLGITSLIGLQLRNRFEARLGLKLQATLVWSYPAIGVLAAHLCDRLAAGSGEVPRVRVPAAVAPAPQATGADDLRSLSEDQLLRRFEDLVSSVSSDDTAPK